MKAKQAQLEAREQAVSKREQDLSKREQDLNALIAGNNRRRAKQLTEHQQREQALAGAEEELKARSRAIAEREAAANERLHAIARAEGELQARGRAIANREAAARDAERDMAEKERTLTAREMEVYTHAHEVKAEVYRLAQEREAEAKQRRLATGSAPGLREHTAAYSIQSGTTKSTFQAVVDGVRALSGLPKDRFVEAEPSCTYPLVVLFIKPSGPRLSEGVIKFEKVERCRTMVKPGGRLLVCTMRGGNDPKADRELPERCPAVDKLLDFCYKSGNAPEPHMVHPSATSSMNRTSEAELREMVRISVPEPPPEIIPSIKMPNWPWLSVKTAAIAAGTILGCSSARARSMK